MVQPRTVVGDPRFAKIIAPMLEFHASTDAGRKERICFDHELVRDQTNAFFAAIGVRACHEIQSIGAIDLRKKSWA